MKRGGKKTILMEKNKKKADNQEWKQNKMNFVKGKQNCKTNQQGQLKSNSYE